MVPLGSRSVGRFRDGGHLALSLGIEVSGRHSPTLEDAVDEHVSILGINLPEASLAWFILLSGHFHEALVERQVVADGVLWKTEQVISTMLKTY